MNAPIAHVYGEPVFTAPQDLFIPPNALQVFLESFEGPLDLLLYLIRRQNIDILNIPMTTITAQYIDYIESLQAARLELAAEYLLMAAVLVEIKSRLLLPRPPAVDVEEEGDPRAELVRRLLEYEQMKQAALALDALPQAERDFLWAQAWLEPSQTLSLPEVHAADLIAAWRTLLKRAQQQQHHQIQQDTLSVREYMTQILRRLQLGESQSYVAFMELFDVSVGVRGLVVCFVAVLELVKEGLIVVSQDAPCAPIWVKLSAE